MVGKLIHQSPRMIYQSPNMAVGLSPEVPYGMVHILSSPPTSPPACYYNPETWKDMMVTGDWGHVVREHQKLPAGLHPFTILKRARLLFDDVDFLKDLKDEAHRLIRQGISINSSKSTPGHLALYRDAVRQLQERVEVTGVKIFQLGFDLLRLEELICASY